MPAVAPAGVPRRILLVDDDASTTGELRSVLEHAGYEVAVAGSFAEGRFALGAGPRDLLISEIRLGQFNGLQLVATSSPGMPAIVLTGYRDAALEAEARRLGADFLVKPVARAALLALVKVKLEPTPPVPVFVTMRCATRKRVKTEIPARFQDAAARVIDIAYGGVRFETEYRPNQSMPARFHLDLPGAGLLLPLELVWTTRAADRWVCGAALVAADSGVAGTWRNMVDAID
jgi:ActR/RegA family two-component response regulator